MTTPPSMTMTLLCAMECSASICVGMPARTRESISLYASETCSLSRITSTRTPLSVRLHQGGGDGLRREGIRLYQNALPGSLDFPHDRVRASAPRRKVHIDRRQLARHPQPAEVVADMRRRKDERDKKNQRNVFLHGIHPVCKWESDSSLTRCNSFILQSRTLIRTVPGCTLARTPMACKAFCIAPSGAECVMITSGTLGDSSSFSC